ncbi:MAG: hypothetical protein FWE88_09555 [Phycisphaerae bacterium]|nr:hypothetical protein [Phycisphaerae bacterium]
MDITKRIARYHRFYESNRPGDLLIAVRQGWVGKKNLFDYDFDRGGHLEMAADVIAGARELASRNGDLDDDMIPWVYPDFGIAIHHAHLFEDLPVRMAEWTSWAPHPLTGPDGFKRTDEIRFNPNNRWIRLIVEMLHYWAEHDDGSYLIIGHGHFSPMDLANALRGNDLFLDFYDSPEELSALMDRCVDAIVDFETLIRTVIGKQQAEIGTPFWGALGPKNAAFISEDVMDMSGPTVSAQWGLPWSRRLRERLGTIMVHHHAMGLPVQRVIAQSMSGSLIQVSDDPNYPPTMETFEKIYAESGDNAIMLDASPQNIIKHIDRLKHTRAILITGGAMEDVQKAVDAVRSVSNIQ